VPIYEYRCENGHNFEVMQRMAEDPLTACEVCGAPVQRVFHPVAVHFKGSGFYNTDYGKQKANRQKAEHDSNSSSSSSSGSDSGSSDSSAKKSDDKSKSSSSSDKGKSDSSSASKTPAKSSDG
jgi:putative FmdB family regulatory protein